MFQEDVIRSALALKLHCFEDTGAIVAAMTTSIPEARGTERTWDYRYCWLRDAFYALGAFRLLGHFEEREQFIGFLLNIAGSSTNLDLAPLYRIDGKRDLEERILEDWEGYQGMGPVRIGNQAALHRQNDVFGEMILALVPLFVDARFSGHVSPALFDLVARLARKAISVASEPDAGIWEFRGEGRRQTFSALMCWAAADRAARIATLHRLGDADEFELAARRIREELLHRNVDPARRCLVADLGGKEVDAALLQAIRLRFIAPDDPVAHGTINAIIHDLSWNGWIRRYRTDDGFGVPQVAFTLCTFWLVEALAITGRMVEAHSLMKLVSTIRSPLRLLSEDVDPTDCEMWGNYPQAYSHAGVIHAAFAASPRWADAE
jgi:GH15 family glucan-1,4-alpha-glucosidase